MRQPCRCPRLEVDAVAFMEPEAIRHAVMRCIETRGGPLDERAQALNAVAVLLEGLVRERLDDDELAASLDGLSKRTVVCDETTLNIIGAFYTLGWGAAGGRGDLDAPYGCGAF